MPSQNYTPIEPISTSPEVEPISSPESSPELEIQEVVEHKIKDEEVKKHVSSRKETIEVSQDLSGLGAQPLPPTEFQSYQTVKLPISDVEVEEGLKKPVNSSWRWLSEFCMFLLHQVHLTIKNIKGKTVRVRET